MPQAPELYSREYYLEDCEGHEQFARSRGRKLSRRLAKCLRYLQPEPGETIVDVGCGRGEIPLHAALRGAHAIALDPSRAALELLGEATRCWRDRGSFQTPADGTGPRRVLGHVGALPLSDESVDKIVLADVLEHFDEAEQAEALRECARALRPGGRAVIHTQPNRTLVRVTVPLLSRVSRLWGVRLPRDLRTEASTGSGPDYHRGELSRSRLLRLLRSTGLPPDEIWLEGTYAIHRIFGTARWKAPLIRLFRRSEVLRRLLATRIFALATKPPAKRG